MLTKHFYSLIDNELSTLVEKYKNDDFIKKHKNAISSQTKSYALLIWFLGFYGRKSNYIDFITDGNDDSSCDIVFDNINNQGEKIFYVVQSKWNNENNSEKETDRDEILKSLNEFQTLLRGEKKNINNKLKLKLEDFDNHLKANGEVKFIFLTLSQYTGGANEDIDSFINNDEKTRFEVIDINRIKSDYIDRLYKKIEPLNPLESYKNPEESPIVLDVIQKDGHNDIGRIEIKKPFEAYMFLLRPKSIYELFEKYGFSLFYKNVRNPLLQSQFNEEIGKTAVENPAYFWYYNNGITAITYSLPAIRKSAEKIELTGLQIINGAQTVYSIYRAYKNSSVVKRKQMDSESFITLRLLKSGGKDFDLNVTRYTNSQNPVDDRDFCANDDIQIMLQNQSYQTNIWYEKRRGEFRGETPENVKKVPNSVFANVYLAYHLQDPVSVLKNYAQRLKIDKDLNFISHREHKEGLYEKIFNEKTSFEDMLCAFYIFDAVNPFSYSYERTFETDLYHSLALFKVAFTKYLKVKYDNSINVNKQVIKIYERGDKDIIIKTFKFLHKFVENQVEVNNNEEKTTEKMLKFLFKPSHYEKVKDVLEDLEISVNDIEDIVLQDNENIIEEEYNGEKIDNAVRRIS